MHHGIEWKTVCRRLACLTPLFLTLILCLLLKENYPFSHFPMYSRFSDRTYYVYVTDRAGDPIPVQSITYIRTSRIKKVYDGNLGRIKENLDKDKRELSPEERAPAGAAALEWLYQTTRDEMKPTLDRLGGLQLHSVEVRLQDGETVEMPAELVGEIALPPGRGAGAGSGAGEEADRG